MTILRRTDVYSFVPDLLCFFSFSVCSSYDFHKLLLIYELVRIAIKNDIEILANGFMNSPRVCGW